MEEWKMHGGMGGWEQSSWRWQPSSSQQVLSSCCAASAAATNREHKLSKYYSFLTYKHGSIYLEHMAKLRRRGEPQLLGEPLSVFPWTTMV